MAVLAVVGGGNGCGDGELFCDTANIDQYQDLEKELIYKYYETVQPSMSYLLVLAFQYTSLLNVFQV